MTFLKTWIAFFALAVACLHAAVDEDVCFDPNLFRRFIERVEQTEIASNGWKNPLTEIILQDGTRWYARKGEEEIPVGFTEGAEVFITPRIDANKEELFVMAVEGSGDLKVRLSTLGKPLPTIVAKGLLSDGYLTKRRWIRLSDDSCWLFDEFWTDKWQIGDQVLTSPVQKSAYQKWVLINTSRMTQKRVDENKKQFNSATGYTYPHVYASFIAEFAN